MKKIKRFLSTVILGVITFIIEVLVEEEEKFLKQFEERAEKGELLSTNEIKEAYIKLVGHSIGHEQIYRVLRRHGYRKIMPRSRHPKKAGDEEIEQSKKKLPVWCKKQK